MRWLLLIAALAACASAGGDKPAVDSPPPIDTPPPPVDMFNGCATQPCDILTQCGCASTDSCDIDFADFMGTACRVINTPGREDATCDASSKCDRGFACIGGSQATCRKYCSANADCGSPRGQCVVDITNQGQPIADIPSVCSSNCDPVTVVAGACPSNFKCVISSTVHLGASKNIVVCSPAGAGAQGASCQSGANNGADSLCKANFLCSTVDGASFNCRHYCNKTANTGCPGGTTCIPFSTPFKIAGVEYGVCN